MENRKGLVEEAIRLDKEIKERTAKLNEVKAHLQAEGLREMENKNLRFFQIFSESGSCEIGYKQKLEIDNYSRLVHVLGSIVTEKVAKKEEVKYDPDKKFKDALIALYLGDYEDCDLEKLLFSDLGVSDEKQRKMLLKKLKGEYTADSRLLKSVGVTEAAEEELDAIRRQRNYELVTRFFDVEAVDEAELKKAIFVEDSLSLGLTYEK